MKRKDPYPRTNNVRINAALAYAHSKVGQPYEWGDHKPEDGDFDATGLIGWAYEQAGVDLAFRSVKGEDIQPGDVVVVNEGNSLLLAVGGGKVIAAPYEGAVTHYQPLSRFQGDITDVRRVQTDEGSSSVYPG